MKWMLVAAVKVEKKLLQFELISNAVKKSPTLWPLFSMLIIFP